MKIFNLFKVYPAKRHFDLFVVFCYTLLMLCNLQFFWQINHRMTGDKLIHFHHFRRLFHHSAFDPGNQHKRHSLGIEFSQPLRPHLLILSFFTVGMTGYVLYLRKDCGDEKSQTISKSFTTIQQPASLPFEDDFEDGNKWLLINGSQVNAWVVDTAAHSGAGTHALYISNDGGLHNAYTVTSSATSYATKAINIEEDGKYIFQYDWRCVGEASYSIYDYMRVVLAPASAELTAGSLVSGLSTTSVPEGWIALDGGALHSSADWQKKSVTATVQAGLYKIVVLWKDDTSGGTQTPAAIDNFSIEQKPCVQPSALAASNITPRSATISWTKGSEDQNAWQLAISTQEGFDPDEINPIIALSNPYELANLNAETTYYVYVRANCGDGDYSAWSSVYSFATLPMCTILGEPEEATICEGDAYTWRGNSYNVSGMYYDTLISVAGCDSIESLLLIVAAPQDTLSIIADKDTIINTLSRIDGLLLSGGAEQAG